MLQDCPACGEPLEDDGDRRYVDSCAFCGWRTKERALSDNANDATLAFSRAVGVLAKEIYEQQHVVDLESHRGDRLPAWPEWDKLEPAVKTTFYQKAQLVLESHREFWRGALLQYREAKAREAKEQPG